MLEESVVDGENHSPTPIHILHVPAGSRPTQYLDYMTTDIQKSYMVIIMVLKYFPKYTPVMGQLL